MKLSLEFCVNSTPPASAVSVDDRNKQKSQTNKLLQKQI